MKYEIICSHCNEVNSIRSDERIHSTFRVFASGLEDIDYDGGSEKQYHSTIEGYLCSECSSEFSYREVIQMITEKEEKQ